MPWAMVILAGLLETGFAVNLKLSHGFTKLWPTVAFCAFLFGYTTLIGWAYYGEQFLEYILGRKVTTPYRWIYCLLIPLGAVLKPELVWNWGDLMNALQVFPNLIGLIGLSGIAAMYAKSRQPTV